MTPIEITLPILPPTSWGKNRSQLFKKKDGSVGFTGNQKIKNTKGLLMDLLGKYAPETPMLGPVALDISVTWPYRKSEKKSIVSSGKLLRKISTPDADAILSTVQDVLETLQFVKNDAQFQPSGCSRFYGPSGSITITLSELEEIVT